MDVQSEKTALLEDEEHHDDDEVKSSGDTNEAIVKEVPWDAQDEIKWLLNLLRIPTDATSPESLAQAIEALDKIVKYGPDDIRKAAQVLVANGGIKWLLEFGPYHDKSASIVKKIMRATGNVAYHQKAVREQIISMNGIHWLLNGSQQYKDKDIIQCNAFCALENIALTEDQARHLILNLSAISSLWEVLQQHEHFARLQRVGCYLLAVMTFHEEEACRQVIALNGGVQFMLDMFPQLERYPNYSPAASLQCLSTLKAYKGDDKISKHNMMRIWIGKVLERLRKQGGMLKV